jgi:host factor-I protein
MTTKRHKGPPAGETGQEALYLKSLSERQVPVSIKLRDGEVVSGWIEYFDDKMVRLTREGKPNLFIYKTQIRTITEGGGPRASNFTIRPGRRGSSSSAPSPGQRPGLTS